ncbi:MAG: MFS transporter [Pseudonocardiales bacterium]
MTTTLVETQAPRRRGGLLRDRDFRLLWIGETTSSLGSSVTSVALPLVALTLLHAGVIAVSMLSAAAWLPWLVIGLPAGAWVDRMQRRAVLIVCDLASLLLFASVPFAAWAGVLTMTQLLVVALLSGVAKVFFSTAYRAYLPALVHGDDLVEGNSRLQGSESAAQVAGPGLGGLLAQAFGAANGLIADAVSFLVSVLCLRGIETREPRVEVPRRALRQEIAEGMRFVARDRLLRVFMIFGGAANLMLTGYGAITVVFLVRGVGLSSSAAGLLIATGSTGGVLGALFAPRLARRIGSARALLVCKVGTTPFGLLIPLTGQGWRLSFFVVGAMGMVAGVVAGNVISGGFMQAYCPPRLMGRITTSMQVVNFGAIPVGAVLGGLLADAAGFRPALWILFGSFVLASLILLAAPIRGDRDLPTRPAEASEPAGTIGT